LKVLTLRTCFLDFQGGNETRSVTEELLGNDELRTKACLVIHEASQTISAAMTTMAR
jgi:hypothetical protein